MSLDIPDIQYSYEHFINNLVNLELSPYHTLKIACYLTEYETWDVGAPSLIDVLERNRFKIENLGEIKKGIIEYFENEDDETEFEEEAEEKHVNSNGLSRVFYFYLDKENKMLYSFTDVKINIIKKIFGKIVNYEPNIYSLFIGASAFYHIIRKINDIDETSECVYFTAKHLPTYVTKGKNRPTKERTFVYYGTDGDGVDTLFELRDSYGVLPRIMRFRMRDIGVLEIQNIGVFTAYKEYNSEMSRMKLLEIIELMVGRILKQKQILVDSKYTLIPIKTKYRTFNVPQIKPWLIKFGSNFDDDAMDNIFDILKDEDFPIYNYVSETGGSFRISGMVADGRKNSSFSVRINNEGMLVAPLENCNFDTFMRFYEMVVEYFDPQSEIIEVIQN